MKTPKPYTPIIVVWEDAASMSGWQHGPAPPPPTCYTLGFFLEKTKRQIVLAAARSEENGELTGVGDLWTIPLGCVVKIIRLKGGPS